MTTGLYTFHDATVPGSATEQLVINGRCFVVAREVKRADATDTLYLVYPLSDEPLDATDLHQAVSNPHGFDLPLAATIQAGDWQRLMEAGGIEVIGEA